jgi:galactokinase
MLDSVTMRAHGRVNLMGEHTDYNGGWVLPTIISQYTEVSLKKKSGSTISLHSSLDPMRGEKREYRYDLGKEKPTGTWVDYLQGATKYLGEEMALRGESLGGLEVHISSNIPEGSGLSSSAALEISFMKALKEMFHFQIDDLEMARIGQRIENEFVGARVGIMDQMASCFGRMGEALFLDTLKLSFQRIPLPLDLMEIMVINSGITHRLSAQDGGYNERRAQCEEAARLLGVSFLREVSRERLEVSELPETLMKRARHVVTENERVITAVEAIRNRDPETLGKIFQESHNSLRDDYEVSIPEIDFLVSLCQKEKNIFGARLTGGGFGGSIVALTIKETKEEISKRIIKIYEMETGKKGSLLV